MSNQIILFKTNKVFKTSLKRNLFIILKLIFGIYHRLSSSKLLRFLAQFYCVFYGVFNIITTVKLTLVANTAITLYSIVLIVESLVYILISLISHEDIITQLPPKIWAYTSILPNSRDSETLAQYFMLVSLIIGRMICNCMHDLKQVLNTGYLFHASVHTTCFLGRLEAVSSTDIYRKAVKALKESIIVKLEEGNLTDDEKVVYLKTFLQVYKKIADHLEFTNIFTFKMLFGFACDFLKIMFFVYYIISINSLINIFVLPWITEIIIHWYIIFAPVVLMELAAGDMDDIKECLANQLLQYKDENLRVSLYDALNYINIRSQKVLWNQFPMDLGLILDFISTCSAYVIALLQFTY